MNSPTPPGSPSDPLAGTPYRALSLLGRGGMGEVFEAVHIALAKRVVVKVLHRHLSLRSDHVSRLRLEGQALAHLSHPNIVAVTDLGATAEGRPYLVMELLEGRTLKEERAARGYLPVAEAVAICRQALAGLGAAHDAGIVHRDVKLDNIFICDPAKEGGARTVKLLDFGIAKVLEVRREGAPAPLTGATEEGVMLGTPRYFSPEQATFGAVDARTDIYAMGMVIYALIAGRGPFEHLTEIIDVLQAHAWTDPEPPSRYAAQLIPPDLDAAILRALAKSPADRHQSAAAFADALTAATRPRPRWASTERIPPGATPSGSSPFAWKVPLPPARRWPITEPLLPVQMPPQPTTPAPTSNQIAPAPAAFVPQAPPPTAPLPQPPAIAPPPPAPQQIAPAPQPPAPTAAPSDLTGTFSRAAMLPPPPTDPPKPR